MNSITLGLLAILASVGAPGTQSARLALSTEPNAASAQQLDQDLRLFAQRHGMRLTTSEFPTSPTGEVAYLLFGDGCEILIREPFNEGEYKAYFYPSKDDDTSDSPADIAEEFRAEVLDPAKWR